MGGPSPSSGDSPCRSRRRGSSALLPPSNSHPTRLLTGVVCLLGGENVQPSHNPTSHTPHMCCLNGQQSPLTCKTKRVKKKFLSLHTIITTIIPGTKTKTKPCRELVSPHLPIITHRNGALLQPSLGPSQVFPRGRIYPLSSRLPCTKR